MQKNLTVDQALDLAKSHASKGNTEEARQLYSVVLASQPRNEQAIKGLEELEHKDTRNTQPALTQQDINRLQALYTSGKLKEALEEATSLSEVHPHVPFLHNVRGSLYSSLGQLDEAVTSYKRALEINPDYAEVHRHLGGVLINLGQPEEAVKCFKRALEINPDDAIAHNNLGAIYNDNEQLDAAIIHFSQALKSKPDYVEAHINHGIALNKLDRPEAAIASYKRALEINPDFVEAHNRLGITYYELGQLDAAIASYERALQIKPDFSRAHHYLSKLKKYRPGDAQISLMENLLSRPEAADADRMHLCFALAKAYEDMTEYDKSFDYLKEANRLRKKELRYDISEDIKLFSIIKDIFRKDRVPVCTAKPDEHPEIRPVFIVGMFRSGTSLVEQILASHSMVYGAGELGFMQALAGPIIPKYSDQLIGQQDGRITQDEIDTVRNGYLESLTALKVSEKIITDKNPVNFRLIGFILSAFPEAKIINLNRDPRATCWSIYKYFFSSKDDGYAYDLVDLARYYKLYIDLMSFWREYFPNRIYDICYEDLTEYQEEETRKLLSFCDLEWEDYCLDFHETDRAVRTVSAAQIRQKMYKGSSDAWKKYEKQLQPLIKSLGL